MYKKSEIGHIPPHHAWNYLYGDAELNAEEHDHALECERCLRLFVLCIQSDSFGALLKELEGAPEAKSA